jgi:hypothetical protein
MPIAVGPGIDRTEEPDGNVIDANRKRNIVKDGGSVNPTSVCPGL